MNPQTAIITHFEEIEPYRWAFRYSARGDLFYEIKETIMEADRSDRHWDPDLCNGKGAWSLDDNVLDDLVHYFPTLLHLRDARLQGNQE